MPLKKHELARNVRVKFHSFVVPSSIGQEYLMTQEEYLYVRDPHVFNDQGGDYVFVNGGSGMNSGVAYLDDLELEFPVSDHYEIPPFSQRIDAAVSALYERGMWEIQRRLLHFAARYTWFAKPVVLQPGNRGGLMNGVLTPDAKAVVITGLALDELGGVCLLLLDQTVRSLDIFPVPVDVLTTCLEQLEDENAHGMSADNNDWYAPVKPTAFLPRYVYTQRRGAATPERYLIAQTNTRRHANFRAWNTFGHPVLVNAPPDALNGVVSLKSGAGCTIVEVDAEGKLIVGEFLPLG